MAPYRLFARSGGFLAFIFVFFCCALAPMAQARDVGEVVMDARTGEIFYQNDADEKMFPASLTKMMTLYITFEAIEHGEISLDTKVKISANAANEPPSKLGLRAGSSIELRYLIRAAAIKSANDAATAIAEAIGGSVPAFADRMNRTARAMGMTNTTFRTANGLPNPNHVSSAHDLAILARHVIYDYPQFYNIFSRTSADAKLATVYSTNRKLLDSYPGLDGIKTGYTNAAGSNLAASAERNGVRIIVVELHAASAGARNARVAQLLDMGFARAQKRVAFRKPAIPLYASIGPNSTAPSAKYAKLNSPRPEARPDAPVQVAAADLPAPIDASAVIADVLNAGPAASMARPEARPVEPTLVASAMAAEAAAPLARSTVEALQGDDGNATVDGVKVAALATANDGTGEVVTMRQGSEDNAATVSGTAQSDRTRAVATAVAADPATPAPLPRPARVTYSTSATPAPQVATTSREIVVPSKETQGNWGVAAGKYNTRYAAEKEILQITLQQIDLLGDSKRAVVQKPTGFEMQFTGLSQMQANLACQRLAARNLSCAPFQS